MVDQSFNQPSNSSLSLRADAKVPALSSLKTELESFLDPILSCVTTLGFFKVFSKDLELNWFFKCVSYFLYKTQKETYIRSQDGSSEGLLPLQSRPNTSELSLLKYAVLIVEGIIKKLVNKSATFAEVTLNGTLSFTRFDTKLVFKPVVQFAEFKEWGLIKLETFDSIKNIQELNELAQLVMTIDAVLVQFELKGCLQDQEYDELLKNVRKVRMKETSSDISISTASECLKHISQLLNLDSCKRAQCLKLFSVVKESRPFYKFAVDKGVAGKDGRTTFHKQCVFVSSHLEQDDYDMAVFSNLRGATDVMMPFFQKNCNFKELMDNIASLNHINERIRQLEDVNKNIELIKLRFHEAEVI